MPMQGIPITATQAKTVGAWRIFGECGPALHNAVTTRTSAGGSATVGTGGVTLSTDATAGEHAVADIPARPVFAANGLLVVMVGCEVNQAIGNLAEGIEIGILLPTGQDGNNIAVFRPDAGDETTGNIRVDNAGTDTDGSVNYPTVNGETHHFSVVVDFDATETRFYIDGNPLMDGDEDASIAAIPGNISGIGAGIFSNATDANEDLAVRYIGYTYVP